MCLFYGLFCDKFAKKNKQNSKLKSINNGLLKIKYVSILRINNI